jgi:rsbT co-antagonist protein RsbR
VIGLVGISRDVTEIKRAEETLKEAHAEIEKQVEERTAELEREVAERTRAEASLAHESDLLQALLDNSPDYIFFKDRESRFVKTNKTHAQVLMGLDSPQEAVGKTDFDLFLREEAQRFYDEEQKIMDTGQPMVAREWSLTSSTTNELVWLSEHKLPIRDETGRVIGLVGISRDITKLKRVEEALKEARAELEQQVRELSTPVIPIMDRILVMPLVGSIDSIRARDITRALLAGISRHQAKVVILDMTGVALVNTQVVNHLNKTMQAAQLKGAQTIVTGMTEAVAETIVDLGIDWRDVQTLADLQTGLRVALSSLDLQLIKYQG